MPDLLIVAVYFAVIGLGAVAVYAQKSSSGDDRLPPSVSVTDERPDAPEFRRTYKARISDAVTMRITIRRFLGTVMRSGELDQTGGRWVLFEPERPANKILDRELLPAIESLCRQIIDADNAWRSVEPMEFTDKAGTTWRHGG